MSFEIVICILMSKAVRNRTGTFAHPVRSVLTIANPSRLGSNVVIVARIKLVQAVRPRVGANGASFRLDKREAAISATVPEARRSLERPFAAI